MHWFIGQKLALVPLTDKCNLMAQKSRGSEIDAEKAAEKMRKTVLALQEFLQSFLLQNFQRLLKIKSTCVQKDSLTDADAKCQLKLLEDALLETVHKFPSSAIPGSGGFAQNFPEFVSQMDWGEEEKAMFFEHVEILSR